MGFLVVLKLLLLVIVIGTALYSGIVYTARRRGSAKELSALRDQTKPLRKLSSDEQDALDPFLVRPDKPAKRVHLTSEEVFPLHGEYRRHGIETNGSQTWHHIIGGVEVILPFDAELFLDHANRAEVVFADKLAVVVRLNGFELLEGAAREGRRDSARDQWRQGARGELEDVFVGEAGADEATGEAEAGRRRVEIHDQRPETATETEARLGRGLGLLPGLLWSLAFLVLGIAVFRETLLWLSLWGALALAIGGWGLWLFWRRRQPGPAGKVNRVSGVVNLVPLRIDEASGTVSVAATLGGKLTFHLPEHWRPHAPLEDGQRLELDLRVDDYSVVTYDRRLSLDEEYRRCPPVYWGRHLTLALVAALALTTALLGMVPEPGKDLTQTGYWLAGAGVLQVNTPATLTSSAAPATGRRVVLDGRGRCQVTATGGDWRYADIRCDRLRWGGDAPRRPDFELDDTTRALIAKETLKTRKDRALRMLALLRGSTGERAPLVLTNSAELVALVDQACEDSPEPRSCRTLRLTLLEALHFPDLGTLESWDDLRQRLAEWDEETELEAVVLEGHLASVRRRMRSVAEQRTQTKVARLAEAIADQQRGGALVTVIGGAPDDPIPPSASALERWEALQALLGDDGVRAFHVSGVVIDRNNSEDGTPSLVVDPERGDRPWAALLRVVWMLLATALLLVHGVLALRAYAAAKRRRQAVARLHGWPV